MTMFTLFGVWVHALSCQRKEVQFQSRRNIEKQDLPGGEAITFEMSLVRATACLKDTNSIDIR